MNEEPPPPPPKSSWWSDRGAMATLITVGAIVLALGVGIVIGRGNGGSSKNAATPQVLTVAGNSTGGGSSSGSGSGSVSEDWPSGASGYTVELSTLDKSAQASDVQSAKSDAKSKGAPSVGVLDGDNHGGTPSGKYVIYSGDYPSNAQAKAALAKVKKNFPNALVLHVTPGGGSGKAGGTAAASGVTAGGTGSAGTQGLSQLQSIQGLTGAARSKAEAKLPSQIGTGGNAPAVDNKKAGGGTSATCIGC